MSPRKKSKPKLIGEIQASKPKKASIKPYFSLTQADMALIEAASRMTPDISNNPDLIGFTTRMLVQANLPHSATSKDVWVRRNGDYYLSVETGYVADKKLGIPYGNVPRLLLIFMCSEAVRTKSRKISFGNNLSAFLKELGMHRSGGERGDINRLKKQFTQLLNAKISFGMEKEGQSSKRKLDIADDYDLFWNPKQPNQAELWESYVMLGERFYQAIVDCPIPLNLEAIAALKQSPLDLDLYTWLTYRVSFMNEHQRISWKALSEQVGSEYGELKNFRLKAIRSFKKISTIWKEIDIQNVRGGFMLGPCQPHVPKKVIKKD